MKNISRVLTPLLFLFTLTVFAQEKSQTFVYGDLLPDAPELSPRGEYKIGVRTLDLVNKDQLDILNFKEGEDVRYDRKLKIEVWYPAALKAGEEEMVSYDEVLGNLNSPGRPITPFTFLGRAAREASPVSGQAFPLIIVSHGYTGSRYLMTYLTENLASKGYVVVSIDHTESTFADAGGFASTLLNRSLDVLFVLNEMDRMSKTEGSFLNGLANADQTGIIGYSMGGYGVLNVAGAGYSAVAGQIFQGATKGSDAIAKRQAGNEEYIKSMDSRVKAVVALAPWGMQNAVWDAEGLKGLKTPTFFIAGSKDDISGYEKGIKAIYTGAANADRYLLTYADARHNIAPNPAPPESLAPGLNIDEYLRYGDSVWDTRRINNINQHFITAFLGIHLKGMDSYKQFIDINANPTKNPWTGFKPRTWIGLELVQSGAAEK